VKRTEKTLSPLGIDDTASAEWWMDPSETQSLPPSFYTLTGSFNTNAVSGLPIHIISDRFQLKIGQEPRPLDQNVTVVKQLQMAKFPPIEAT